jgi:hypothetical protein
MSFPKYPANMDRISTAVHGHNLKPTGYADKAIWAQKNMIIFFLKLREIPAVEKYF